MAGRTVHGLALAGLAVAAAVSVTGCDLLATALRDVADPAGPGAGRPLYSTGTAVLEIEGMAAVAIPLESADVFGDYQPLVVWRSVDGWQVVLEGPANRASAAGTDAFTVDFWRFSRDADSLEANGAQCLVTVRASGPAGLDGTATCDSLFWTKTPSDDGPGVPNPTSALPSKAQVTFTAQP